MGLWLAVAASVGVSRLQSLLDLTPGNLITHADRAAFERYSIALRQLLGPV